MKQTLLWQADTDQLIQELLKRKCDLGRPYFHMEIQQSRHGWLRVKLLGTFLDGSTHIQINDQNGE
tara:strand:+ start:633 stop:830 length:198 start_codon:yes stop_codon:yes gene_type:complete